MKYKFLGLVAVSMVAVVLFMAALSRNDADDFLENRAMITVRAIGHQLLLAGHDSTSRVLPVQQLSRGIFQLEFQNKFSFVPDTLVNIVMANLEQINTPLNYLVNVFDCESHEIVYAFEINPKKNDIIPCLGRDQPAGCYSIQIAFVDYGTSPSVLRKYAPFAIGLVAITLIVFFCQGLVNRKEVADHDSTIHSIVIGRTNFFPAQRKVVINEETTDLSAKETRLLKIFASQPNQLILREQLLKEVWEDDGVFTGRSLDMFVSKLRKKLKNDSTLTLINVHGQGYKLEVSAH